MMSVIEYADNHQVKNVRYHSHWKTVFGSGVQKERYGFVENQDFLSFLETTKKPSGGRPSRFGLDEKGVYIKCIPLQMVVFLFQNLFLLPKTGEQTNDGRGVIMNELIKIESKEIGSELVQTVSARELHQFLEVGRKFATWIQQRIEKYDFIENEDFLIISQNRETTDKDGKLKVSVAKEYYISIDMAKELAMVENNDKGREARKYFIECEKQLKSSKQVISTDESKMRALSFVISQTSLSDIAKETLLITTAESALGFPINYRPQLERKTYTATQIGEQLGISANKVGKLTNAHNLKTDTYGIRVLDKARGHSKQVETFRYYENVVPVLKALIN